MTQAGSLVFRCQWYSALHRDCSLSAVHLGIMCSGTERCIHCGATQRAGDWHWYFAAAYQ